MAKELRVTKNVKNAQKVVDRTLETWYFQTVSAAVMVFTRYYPNRL